jgi:O-antigen/teichoic acid export membrane protein
MASEEQLDRLVATSATVRTTLMRLPASIARRVPSGSFARGATTIMLGTGAAQAITIGSSPIITRLYSPQEFGAFGVAASLLAILAAVTCLAYEFAIPLPSDDVRAADVTVLCLVVAGALSLLVGVVLTQGGSTVLGAMDAGALVPYAPLLALGMFAGGVALALVAFMVRVKAYREMAVNRVVTSVLTVVGQVGLGLLGAGTPGLLIGFIAANTLAVLRLGWVASRMRGDAFRRVTRAGMAAAARRYRRFPVLSAPSNLVNALTLQLPLLMIVAIFGAAVGGQFVLAQRVIALPAVLVAQSVGQAFLAESAVVARTRPQDLRRLFGRTTRALAMAALPPVALVALATPFAFPIAFGSAWAEAGLYAALLAPMHYFQFVTNPTSHMLDVLERQDLFLAREILRLAVLALVFVAIVALGLGPLIAVAAVSVAGSVAYLVSGLLAWRAVVTHGRRNQTSDSPIGPA